MCACVHTHMHMHASAYGGQWSLLGISFTINLIKNLFIVGFWSVCMYVHVSYMRT